MIKRTVILPLTLIVLALSGGIAWTVWGPLLGEDEFDCWGRLHTRIQVGDCQRTSAADVFLSMQADGKGYLLVNGNWSCQNSLQNVVEGTVNFTFEQEGDYFAIRAKEKVPALEKIIGALRYESLKLKITPLNSADYILQLPNEKLMICTKN
ncbi:hypothetical protein ABEH87_13615 [Erwinia sp. Eh17-17]|jgi:hypothetical protein|uniref:hypothetical protein n=1 Tax=Erwinia sp. Eh17-17 TaxID=3080330 RepID=UPI0032096A42